MCGVKEVSLCQDTLLFIIPALSLIFVSFCLHFQLCTQHLCIVYFCNCWIKTVISEFKKKLNQLFVLEMLFSFFSIFKYLGSSSGKSFSGEEAKLNELIDINHWGTEAPTQFYDADWIGLENVNIPRKGYWLAIEVKHSSPQNLSDTAQ